MLASGRYRSRFCNGCTPNLIRDRQGGLSFQNGQTGMSVLRQQKPAGFTAKFALIIYFPATKKSFLDDAGKRLAFIRSQLMTMLQPLPLNFELFFWIPNYQIGIIAGRDHAFTIL